MKLSLTKVGKVFVPSDAKSVDIADGLNYGTELCAEVSKKFNRSGPNLKRFFVFLHTAFEMQEFYKKGQEDKFREDILVMAGWADTWVNYDGETRVRARSISYKELGTEEVFQQIFKSSIEAFFRMYQSMNGQILNYDDFIQKLQQIEAFQ